MPTTTYTPLANITLSSSAASVTFSSISGLYRDLVLVVSGKTASGSGAMQLRFNADSGSNYTSVYMGGSGSATGSGTFAAGAQMYMTGYAVALGTTNFAQYNISIMDYSATDKHKTVLARPSLASNGVDAIAGRWASTSAITSVLVNIESGLSFASGSTFALYGIAA